MIFTFLGTGTSQGIPVIACNCEVCTSSDVRDFRFRTSGMFEVDNKVLVIDTGPDFRQQMLQNKVKTIDAVIYTHEHKDHIAGMDDVRPFNYIQKKNIELYANQRVKDALHKDFHYAFDEKFRYPGIPLVNINLIENKKFDCQGIEVLPIEVLHYKLPVLGFRIKDFSYITDANYIADTEMEKLKGSRVLVLNALRHETHISHFNLKEALQIIEEVNPERAYLTHISHHLGLHEEVQKQLPQNVFLAYDGLRVEI
jgi:phosphoribosyl 1,2-cyclic phosphate phosphodiesterase